MVLMSSMPLLHKALIFCVQWEVSASLYLEIQYMLSSSTNNITYVFIIQLINLNMNEIMSLHITILFVLWYHA